MLHSGLGDQALGGSWCGLAAAAKPCADVMKVIMEPWTPNASAAGYPMLSCRLCMCGSFKCHRPPLTTRHTARDAALRPRSPIPCQHDRSPVPGA